MTTTISRRLTRTAYPRNGNVRNPTKYYAWDVVVNGRTMYVARTMREAKSVAVACAKEFASGEATA